MAGAAGLPLSPPQTIGGRRVDNLKEKVVIAVSSRALFDLEEEHALFEEKGYKAFRDHQVRYQNTPLRLSLIHILSASPMLSVWLTSLY